MAYNITLDPHLKLQRCPHCSIDNPNLTNVNSNFNTGTDTGSNIRIWQVYKCSRCGGVVTAFCYNSGSRAVVEVYPASPMINEVLPTKVRSYLQQAIDSTFAPSGSVMLCASAVDAILKEKGYKDGSLYKRIDLAANNGLITADMAKWAHQVRLDANDERHADEEAILPTVEDAKQSIEFTKTLAELIFVLPSKVTRGIQATTQANKTAATNSTAGSN